MTPFLTAVWSDLALFSYAIPAEVLTPYLPPGVEADLWQGQAYCSLVAFDFTQTRVLGWSVPYPRTLCDFPEFNLRFYVRYGAQRGVMFVRELVPNWAVAGIARVLYNEPYQTANMTSRSTQVDNMRRVRHDFVYKGTAQMAALTSHKPAAIPAPESFETWVKEQEMGFGRSHFGQLTRYRVYHPEWRVFPVEDYALKIDFTLLYGAHWSFLQERVPDSVVHAEGSNIAIYPQEK